MSTGYSQSYRPLLADFGYAKGVPDYFFGIIHFSLLLVFLSGASKTIKCTYKKGTTYNITDRYIE
jgi:hypothetical protein